MHKGRREFVGALAALGGTAALATGASAAEAKPLTTAGLAKSLLTLADKAELQGMRREAQAIYAAVKVVLEGTPAGRKGER